MEQMPAPQLSRKPFDAVLFDTARVSVEIRAALGWEGNVGSTGEVVGRRTIGTSAPLKELQRKFGFTLERIVAATRDQVAKVTVV
jgi:transketolase